MPFAAPVSASKPVPLRDFRDALRALACLSALLAAPLATRGGRAEELAFRVESEVFVNGVDEPVARSLTLFRAGVAWDFLDPPKAARGERQSGGAPAAGEIVLHDPARERVVLVDPVRNLKTQIDAIRLDRLSASLSSWARKSDDKLVRWAGGPDFGEGLTESRERIELAGPRVRYAVEFTAAPSPEAAAAYQRFADTAILLKALVRPGGVPPFPRLAINRRVALAGGIPTEVTLDYDARAIKVPGRSDSLRCVHKIHPRLLAADLSRIEDAESSVGLAKQVDLAEFVAGPARPAGD
jgi:hypothetical protein